MLDAARGKFTHYVHDERDLKSIGGNDVWAITQVASGAIWVGGYAAGIDRLVPGATGFAHYRHDAAEPHSIASDTVLGLIAARDGRLWVGSEGGIDVIEVDGSLRHVDLSVLPDSHRINANSMLDAGDGTVLVGTRLGLLRIDAALHASVVVDDRLSDRIVNSVVAGAEPGELWIATRHGLDHLAPAGTISAYLENPAVAGAFPGENAYDAMRDREGTLWFATFEAGVVKLPASWHNFALFRNDPADAASLERQPHAGLGSGRRGAHLVGKPRRRHRPARPGDRSRRTLRRRPARRSGQGDVVRARRQLRPALGRLHAWSQSIRIAKWKILRPPGFGGPRRRAGARPDESHRAGSRRFDLGVGIRQFRRRASHRSGESSRGTLRRQDRRPARCGSQPARFRRQWRSADRQRRRNRSLRCGHAPLRALARRADAARLRFRVRRRRHLVAARAGCPRTLSCQWRRAGARRAHRCRTKLAGADRRRPAGRFRRSCLGQQRARTVALRSRHTHGARIRSSRRAGQFGVQPPADGAQGRWRDVCRYAGRDRRLPAAAHCGKCDIAAAGAGRHCRAPARSRRNNRSRRRRTRRALG